MDFKWEQRRGRALGRDAASDEDLARTVALSGGPDQAGPFDETLPLHDAAARAAALAQVYGERKGAGAVSSDADAGGDGDGVGDGGGGAVPPARVSAPDQSFDGSNYGRYRDEEGLLGAARVPGQRRPRVSRRVLFAAGGLSLVGGCGVAAAAGLSGSKSSKSAAASPFGPGSPSAAHSPSASAHASPSASHSPVDLSSSSATAQVSGPADVTNPSSGANGGTVQSAPEYFVHAGPKVVALTLDDGPHPVYTPQVLALLQQYGIRATFCMIGRQVSANKSLVGEVVAAGHVIVNHTWDHADQSKLTMSKVNTEIDRTNQALADVGVHPTIYRAPYGAWSPTVFQACAAANLRPLDWSVDPRDWSMPGTSTIVSRILHQTKTGSIILEHDGGGDRSQTVAALKIVLPELLGQGYRFTNV